VILANDYIGENHLNMNMFATMFAGDAQPADR
jgi:hypothetical protein